MADSIKEERKRSFKQGMLNLIVVDIGLVRKSGEECVLELRKKLKDQVLHKKRTLPSPQQNIDTSLVKCNNKCPQLIDTESPIVAFII